MDLSLLLDTHSPRDTKEYHLYDKTKDNPTLPYHYYSNHFDTLQDVTNKLLEWFSQYKRALPWREARSAYRVWISEIMLQQTQVKTVIPYFERWLTRFPTVQDVANAPLDDVLKHWEGLGYYRRAKNLHKSAQIITREHNGVVPADYATLLTLPGIGSYTAAAIASFVTNEAVIAVDGNVKRVAARLFMLRGNVSEKKVKEKLELLLPRDKAGVFNEALIELGALVCTPLAPDCSVCPLSAKCMAFQAGRVPEFPEKVPRKRVPHVARFALVDVREDAVFLRQRAEDEMLGGLWGFVLVDKAPAPAQRLTEVKHAYTHFRLTVTPVITRVTAGIDGQYVPVTALAGLALSTLDRKVLTLLEAQGLIRLQA